MCVCSHSPPHYCTYNIITINFISFWNRKMKFKTYYYYIRCKYIMRCVYYWYMDKRCHSIYIYIVYYIVVDARDRAEEIRVLHHRRRRRLHHERPESSPHIVLIKLITIPYNAYGCKYTLYISKHMCVYMFCVWGRIALNIISRIMHHIYMGNGHIMLILVILCKYIWNVSHN